MRISKWDDDGNPRTWWQTSEGRKTFPEWMEYWHIPERFSDVFSWPDAQIVGEYNVQFDMVDNNNQRVRELEDLFENTRQERHQYMDEYGIEQWGDLASDSEHLIKQGEFSKNIEAYVSELKQRGGRYGFQDGNGLKGGLYNHPLRGNIRALALLAGILEGHYASRESVLDEYVEESWISRSRLTGDIIRAPTGEQQLKMDAFGPLHNEKWCMYPKIE